MITQELFVRKSVIPAFIRFSSRWPYTNRRRGQARLDIRIRYMGIRSSHQGIHHISDLTRIYSASSPASHSPSNNNQCKRKTCRPGLLKRIIPTCQRSSVKTVLRVRVEYQASDIPCDMQELDQERFHRPPVHFLNRREPIEHQKAPAALIWSLRIHGDSYYERGKASGLSQGGSPFIKIRCLHPARG